MIMSIPPILCSDSQPKGRVIDLISYHENYRETVSDVKAHLETFSDEIGKYMFLLAVQGKWKKWEEGVAVGTEIELNYAMFRETDDKNIQLLLSLIDKVQETHHALGDKG